MFITTDFDQSRSIDKNIEDYISTAIFQPLLNVLANDLNVSVEIVNTINTNKTPDMILNYNDTETLHTSGKQEWV